MARTVNRVELLGNLAGEPTFVTQNAALSMRFTLVTHRGGGNGNEQIAEHHRVELWGGIAESLRFQDLHKGDQLYVTGRIQRDGSRAADVIAKEVVICQRAAR